MNPPPPGSDPKLEYSRRLEARRAASARYERLHRDIGNVRVLVFALAVAVVWLAFARGQLSPLWALPPAAVFIALVIFHERVIQARRRFDRAAAFYERGLARLDNRWSGAGEAGERFLDPTHPYSEDLDLFGKGSLFELLCTARTRAGEETLAGWLRAPSPPQVVRARQEAVAELRPSIALREDLAVLGEDVRAEVHSEALAAWGEQSPLLESRPARIAAAVLGFMGLLALAAITTVLLSAIDVLVLTPRTEIMLRDIFLVMAIIEGAFGLRLRRQVLQVVHAVEQPAHLLELLSHVLVRLEREQFTSARLAELRSVLDIQGWPPSRRIARLNRLIELLDSRDNVLLRVIGPMLLWTTQLAFAVEAWRRTSGPSVRRWLAAVGEMEALSALAGYAYEHPADPFPEFTDDSPCFEGEGLGHPLLPVNRVVRNDLRLGGELRVLIVSGSNMSGKSTLLRTVGTNAVLAQAGAPVRATRLRLSPIHPGASIRILDSLQGGSSRFYAEITRLRRIVDLTQEALPVLFLLDEFLHGTNSHDRRIGAEALVRSLVERGAIGLVTTHDLALAHIADALGPRGANVHFEDYLEGGKISFDYRMRPGIVRKSNALELMRSVGLDV